MISHKVELTEKQMAATSIAATSYFAITVYNKLIDPITKEPISIDMLASVAEVVSIFSHAIGNKAVELPELIKQINQIVAERNAMLEAQR